MTKLQIEVRGIVQGVGFRPFVHRLVKEHGLSGWVRNTADGAGLELEGEEPALEAFLAALREDAPPLAIIESVEARPVQGGEHFEGFSIVPSERGERMRTLISPDAGIARTACASARPCRQAVPLPLHKLHQLRTEIHDNKIRPLRPGVHLHVGVSDVPGLRGGV